MTRLNTKSTRKGLSLIELIIAIAILVAAFGAVLSLNSKTVKTSTSSRDESVATRFVSEGMEGVKSIRENTTSAQINFTSGTAQYWNNLYTLPSGMYFFQISKVTVAGLGDIWQLNQLPASNVPVSTSAVQDDYYRRVILTISGSDQPIRAQLEVCWGKGTDTAACFNSSSNTGQIYSSTTLLRKKTTNIFSP